MPSSAVVDQDVERMQVVQGIENTNTSVVASALRVAHTSGHGAHDFVTKQLMLENWTEVCDIQVVGMAFAAWEQLPLSRDLDQWEGIGLV